MNIEDMKKRKELMEKNFQELNNRIKIDTENALRLQGAIMDINEIIVDEEKELKENKEAKKEDKKKKVR